MTSFDADSFGRNVAGGAGILGAAGTAFGLPTCILDLSKDALALLPSPVLGGIDAAANEIRARINSDIKKAFYKLAETLGLKEYLGPDGTIRLRSTFSLGDLGLDGLVGGIAGIIGAAADLYQQYQDIKAYIDEIKECLQLLKDSLDKADNTSLAGYATPMLRGGRLAALQNQLENLNNLNKRIKTFQEDIEEEFALRDEDPNREPRINPKYADDFANTGFLIGDDTEEEELFRLVYGPPLSRDGQFLLSVDGLYYDSQSEDGYLPILLQLRDKGRLLDVAEKWKFNFDPNLGGKGEQIAKTSFNKWVNSIFDLNIIDNSESMEVYYDADGFLRLLEGQRDKRILDIQNQIDTLVSEGASTAIINNFKQGLVSETALLQTKVDRRKKQIEIAVKAPSICGEPNPFPTGAIPVNDFSYLQKYNISIALQEQEKLVINTESVEGIVLPIIPKFVKVQPKRAGEVINELIIPEMGFDAIITDELDSSDTSAAELNINEMVNTDGLFALYNFLNSDTTLPSAIDTNLNNCYSMDTTNDSYLVAKSAKDFFERLGLCAPYFKGITSYETGVPTLGTFAKLANTNDFQDWTYKNSGFSFESWVYMPTLNLAEAGWKDNGVSSLYRLILANENTGIREGAERLEDYNFVPYSNGNDYTRGMIFGFTIDQRWTRKELPSNNFNTQDPLFGYGLILAPTISYDSSSTAFIANPECDVDLGWLGMYVPSTKQTPSGKTLADCLTDFLQIAFSVDYKQDLITVFLDGEVLETSSASEVFGTRPHHTINIPSFKTESSFEYSSSSVSPIAKISLKKGPKTYPFFTPWILGGGYTDGYKNGGFMGGIYGGTISGLRGYLGSVKFYNKPVSTSGVVKNYEVQKRLFKQVKQPKPVIIAVGQSNIDGNASPVTFQLPTRYHNNQSWCKIWTPDAVEASSGRWIDNDIVNTPGFVQNPTPGYAGLNATRYFITSTATRFDPATTKHYDMLLRFTELLSEYENQPIYLIKNCKDSTSMASGIFYNGVDQAPASWTDKTSFCYDVQGSGLYTTLVRDVSAALDQLKEDDPKGSFEVKAIVMIQGEADSFGYDGLQPNYLTPSGPAEAWAHSFSSVLYADFQKDLKNILGNPDLDDIPWIIGHIHTDFYREYVPGGAAELAFNYVVRQQQENVANNPDLNVHLVDLEGLSFTDGSKVHFDGPSLYTIGERFFSKYLEVIQ